MRKVNYTHKKPRNTYLVFLFIIVIPVAYYFLFVMNSQEVSKKEASEYLVGSWQRTDGPYTIKIKAVNKEGNLHAEYYNPNPVNVDKSGWRVQGDTLQIYVRMDDVNYRGSFYELNYNKENSTLSGTYFQAATKQAYNVMFEKSE